MNKTEAERRIEQDATAYAKANRARIAREQTDPAIFLPEEHPVSVFMAGSPAGGKTEASKELLQRFADEGDTRILRIDPDDLRELIPGYTGGNAWLFQHAVIRIVEAIHDRALKQNQSFVLDGTLSSYDVAAKNVQRSLRHGRVVQILYVYQEPAQAWRFVCAREAAEGRRIQPDDFVRQYFAARTVVNRLKADFGKEVSVDLLVKDNDGSSRIYRAGIDNIDNHVPEKYSLDDVRHIVELP